MHYEPETVRLAGRVRVQQEYGPPNFGEVPDKDERLRVTYLDLVSPIDVCGDTTAVGDDNRESLRDVRQVQLNFAKLSPALALPPGQPLAVRGRLYHSFSGYHFTDAVLDVVSVEARP